MNGPTLSRNAIQRGAIFLEEFVATMVLLLSLTFLGFEVFAQSETARAALDISTDLKSRAEQGDARAQLALGHHCFTTRDPVQAAIWVERSANQGFGPAQLILGLMYEEGEGVPKNDKAAVKWIRLAAEGGYAPAEATLGNLYLEGRRVPKSPEEAVKWYRKAADKDDAIGQFGLALAYQSGEGGVPQDDVEAANWLLKAAEHDYVPAQIFLASMYTVGKGLPRDLVEAVKWVRKAAELGNVTAQSWLRGFYFNGQGVPQDYVESYKWAIIAAIQGDPKNIAFRDQHAKKLTKEQIAEGQRRASAFVAKGEKEENELHRSWRTVRSMPDTSQPKSSGSGFVITADGYLLTSSHVVVGANSITVKTMQGQFPAKLVRADAVNDVALLKISGSFYPLPIMASHTVKLGDSVLTIGFPNTTLQGVEPKLTRGEINSLAGLKDDPRHFQISVAVQPGNSGGPLVDSFGNVVGIVTARLSEAAALRETGALPQVVNYALKSSFIAAFLESTHEVMSKLAKPDTIKSRRSEDVVKEVQEAAALVLVY